MNKQYTVASLFAGIGGVDLGFKKAGFNIKWANEIDEKACKTYNANFDHEIICDDIKNIKDMDLPEVDILTAGFPCQAFSIAGLRKGFKDDRGSLFFDVMDLVKKLKPRVLFLENVKNLQSHDDGKTLDKILSVIDKSGYFIKHKVLNTAEYSDLPQNRERIYIVCFRNKNDYNNFEFIDKEDKALTINDLLDEEVDNKYYYNNSAIYDRIKDEITDKNSCYQWRRKYVRQNKSNLCPTLTANMGTGGHNVPLILDDKDIRKLTPRECLRFQGFTDDFNIPDDLSNASVYKQAGNSVSVPVIERLATNLMRSFS